MGILFRLGLAMEIYDATYERRIKALKAENERLLGYLRETREMLVWDSDHRGDYKRINELRPIIDALLKGKENK